ncbi:hypothetical protein ACOB87_02595 [Streptomyces sp. YS-B37]|uniref:hypothetical protein n=1 Tax=Streptomyces sp. YS-B37 TaxID=3407669 RepID=UPI003B509398
MPAWIATGHAAVRSTTGNPGLSSARYPALAAVSEELRPLAVALTRQMLYNDTPNHPRLRGLRTRTSEAVDEIIAQAAPTSSRTWPAHRR